MSELQQPVTSSDPWAALKAFTAARIALGRTGTSEPLQAMLQFRLAHAHARDAVYAHLQQEALTAGLQQLQQPVYWLHSQATDRSTYLQRPDLGRKLQAEAVQQLTQYESPGYDVAIVLADGLSATAINQHAVAVLSLLLPALQQAGFTSAPVCVVQQARVAAGDEVGALLKAKMVIVLIGERPGLSAPNSMGTYITWQPQPGLTDEARNCISNIRPEGLNYTTAVQKMMYLVTEAMRLQLSGVALKDNTGKIKMF